MPRCRTLLPGRNTRRFAGVALLALALCALPVVAAVPEGKPIAVPPAPPGLEMHVPESVEELKNLEKQVKAVTEKVMPAVVGLQVGQSSGSGVIISADGYILTAGHVSGEPNKDLTVILPDGRHVKGKSLGNNALIDSGMAKIVDEGPWPFCEMGKSGDLKKGEWVIGIGHPGGFKKGRTPVVRLGRIQQVNDMLIRTDCTLVGGDSGGPLFSLDGKVIGIHSRIGNTLATNIHVPVDTFRETWDRLAKGEKFRARPKQPEEPATDEPFIGLSFAKEKELLVEDVFPKGPADQAGVQPNDVVLKFDGRKVTTTEELKAELGKRKAGDEVTLEVQRGDKETLTLKIKLGRRS